MAKFAYDVNTTRRYIDIHKQFNGGLKTVDTDDSLGSVFLRQAENVSLSEFGFIEKRYGTIEKELIKTTNGTLQGYWEYMGFAIYAIDNKFYYKNSTGTEVAVSSISEEDSTYRYPATRPTYNASGFGSTGPFRDMNAVNINSVLYIFTGFYPVYVKLNSSNVPEFYWFSVTVPTYDEIVVTGHNLLEDNYDSAYGYTQASSIASHSFVPSSGYYPQIKDTSFYPNIPYALEKDGKTQGTLTLRAAANFDGTFNIFNPVSASTAEKTYREIKLDSVKYRTSLPGAAREAFININPENLRFTTKTNYFNVSGAPASIDLTGETYKDEAFTADEVEYFTRQMGDNNTGYQTFQYDLIKEYTIDKESFLRNKKYAFRLFEKQGNGRLPWDFNSFAGGPNTNAFTNKYFITIIPMVNDSEDGSLIEKTSKISRIASTNTVSNILAAPVNGVYKFDVPTDLYTAFSVVSYKVRFTHMLTENISGSGNTPTGPSDIETAFADYFLDLTVMDSVTQVEGSCSLAGYTSQSTCQAAGGVWNLNRITQAPSVSSLDIVVSDLIAGTYDFEVTYSQDAYSYDSSGQTLKYEESKKFSGIVSNVNIIAEEFQDIPGQDTDFLPKAKPIWSCNKVIEHYGKLMVWGSEDDTNGMPTAIFYSFPDRPTYFPAKFYLDFSNDTNQKIEALTPYMNILVAQTASQTFGIRGNSGMIDAPAPYVPFGINPTVGTIAYKSVRPIRNQLLFLSKQGIIALTSLYAVDENYNIKFVDRVIRDGVTVKQDPKAIAAQFDNQYWLNFPDSGITLRWYIDKKAFVKDIYQGYATNGFKGVFKYQIVDGNLEFITHPSTVGTNAAIYKIGVDKTIPTDLFQPIRAKFETSFLNQNYPFHPKNYKEAKLDFTLQNEYNLGRDAIYDSTQDAAFTDAGGGGTSTLSFNLPKALDKNHRYRIEFTMESGSSVTHLPVTSILIEGQSSYSTNLTPVGTATNTLIWEFNITNAYKQETAIDIVTTLGSEDAQAVASIVVRDVTYDTNLAFSTYVISEDKTLNFDNSPGYSQATVDVDLDLTLKGRLGDWTFGESDFGDKVTAVKTIKLSGKGYNAKIYVEDVSKSKWTLESLGLTYKMKRARSR